jgi:hypothetical protein
MKRLKHLGQGYHGTLPAEETGTIFVKPGEVVEVSQAKAEQLFADFPGEWEETEDAVGAPIQPVAAAAVAPETEADEPEVDVEDEGSTPPTAKRRRR